MRVLFLDSDLFDKVHGGVELEVELRLTERLLSETLDDLN